MAKTCEYNCFECIYDDCVVNGKLTAKEKLDAFERDVNYTSYGKVYHGKQKSKMRKVRKF